MNKLIYRLLINTCFLFNSLYSASASDEHLLLLNHCLKEQRGALDIKPAGAYFVGLVDAATGRTIVEISLPPGDRLSDYPDLNHRIKNWKKGVSFMPLLSELTDAQLLLLRKANESWDIGETYIVNEGDAMDDFAVFNSLPQTLQHQRLFRVIFMTPWQRLLSFLCR